MLVPLSGLALVIVLGVAAQWLAWRVKLPSILMLLTAGIAVGPVWSMLSPASTPLLNPDELLPDLLLPLVGLSVGLILYEGGLTLRLRDLGDSQRSVWSLCTLAALVTWVLSAALGYLILGLPIDLAVLLGAILVVTGPTVIQPLVAHVRPKGKLGPILKWEGIVIDPIGASLAVLVYEAIAVAHKKGSYIEAAPDVAIALITTIVVGMVLGFVSAWLLTLLISKHLVPDELQNPVSLLIVVGAFAISDKLMHESGLLTATVMGIVLANQTKSSVHHILEFKENLRVLLIGSLFVLLGARLAPEQLQSIGFEAVLFVLALVILVRPLSVMAATWRSSLTMRERAFLCWMAPRGIVAAAVASVFALRLENLEGYESAEQAASLVPTMFAVIIGTVAIYGLTAGTVARWLGVSDQNPQGIVFIGANRLARDIATILHKRGIRVLLSDTNRQLIRQAQMQGLPTYHGSVLAERALDEMDLTGVGRVIAATPNNEVNSLATQRFAGLFDSVGLFQLAPSNEAKSTDKELSKEFRARPLFAEGLTYGAISLRLDRGHVIKATSLSEEFTWDDYLTLYGDSVQPMFVIAGSKVTVVTPDKPIAPEPGQTVVSLVDPDALLIRSFRLDDTTPSPSE